MNFTNYSKLCDAMCAARKAGQNIEADYEILDTSIQVLVGSFKTDAYINIQQLIRGSSDLQIEDTSTARDAVNDLCVKYGVPLVCAPDEAPRQTAADVAAQVVELLGR